MRSHAHGDADRQTERKTYIHRKSDVKVMSPQTRTERGQRKGPGSHEHALAHPVRP